MIITPKKIANTVGAKTARACDSCMRSRARWYCTADDAFLCQLCDSSVHSANQLASRHERVRLESTSNKPTQNSSLLATSPPPAWHHGFTRKARTRRAAKPNTAQFPKEGEKTINPLPLVPEIGSEEGSVDENEDQQLLCRVPNFDPFEAENNSGCDDKIVDLHGFFESDMDLADFAADVESLLGRGLDDDTCGIEGLGFFGCKEENNTDKGVKIEDEELEAVLGSHLDPGMDGARDFFDWNFDYEDEEEEDKVVNAPEKAVKLDGDTCKGEERRSIFLRLNYEEVISAWASQGSPWRAGVRPEFNSDVTWSYFMGNCSMQGVSNLYGDVRERMLGGGDGGREARVSRYREKRRTRLFSKKIRYEVRKLNAEKRPRIKGRFVRRTNSFGGQSFPNYIITK